MFFVVAFFVINANASPAPKFFQEALAVPAGKFLLLSHTTFLLYKTQRNKHLGIKKHLLFLQSAETNILTVGAIIMQGMDFAWTFLKWCPKYARVAADCAVRITFE